MTSFKSIFTILLLGFLVGCVKADKTAPNAGDSFFGDKNSRSFSYEGDLTPYNASALFQAGNIQLRDIEFSYDGQSAVKGKSEKGWKEVNRIYMQFQVCGLKDITSQGTLRTEKFHIKSDLGENISWSRNTDEEDFTEYKLTNPVTVNSDTCLVWAQKIPKFDFLGEPHNLVFHFEIQSLSGNMGRIVRRIGFNPWDMHRNKTLKKSGWRDLTNLARHDWGPEDNWVSGPSVVPALSGELTKSSAQLSLKGVKITPYLTERGDLDAERLKEYQASLKVMTKEARKVRAEVDKKLMERTGLHLNVNLKAFPFIRLQNSSNLNDDSYQLNNGQFRVQMHLVASGVNTGDVLLRKDGKKRIYNNGHKVLLTSNVHHITGRNNSYTYNLNQNGLLASVPLYLENFPRMGRVELVVKVTPDSPGLDHVKPFMGVYDLGEWSGWSKSQSPEFKMQGYKAYDEVGYDQYLSDVDGLAEASTALQPAERYYFDPFTIRFVRFMPGETATDRTLQYRVETCITEGVSGARVGPGLQFNIETSDIYKGEITERRMTDQSGCLVWFGFLSHKYYRKEVLETKVAKVTFAGTSADKRSDHSGNIVNPYQHSFTYYMNPWDEKFTFGWDERRMPENYPQEIEDQRKDAPASKLFIADFNYTTIGFRYAIDKYLNLKVKKAVLLKLFPYALKYNSIVFGRKGTEKLRDGVYLMKVALQKDYLDPAARGVRIYDTKLSKQINIASNEKEVVADCRARVNQAKKDGTYSIKDENYPFGPYFDWPTDEEGNLDLGQIYKDRKNIYDTLPQNYRTEFVTALRAGTNTLPAIEVCGDEIDNDRMVSDEVLQQSKKQYISAQEKLVRVLGGIIITPLEFEVDDLRLMRIRNQLFIQLETIDERKLRWATLVNDIVDGLASEEDFLKRYQEIYDLLGYEGEVNKLTGEFQDQEIENKLKRLFELNAIYQGGEVFGKQGYSLQEAREKMFALMGVDPRAEETTPEDLKRAEAKLLRIVQYMKAGQSEVSAYKNDKRLLIDSLTQSIAYEARQKSTDTKDFVENLANRVQGQPTEYEDDPWLQFMYAGTHTPKEDLLASIIRRRLDEATSQGNQELIQAIRSLTIADFTESPLTPNYSFDYLSNEGVYVTKGMAATGAWEIEKNNEEKSGLPSRTFLGPLTFVFNTNGSSLRPTDILNENFCLTAFCEQNGRTEVNDRVVIRGAKIRTGVKLDTTNQLIDDLKQDVYMSDDSVNQLYESNKFYGNVGAYFNKSVDDLIAEKIKIDKETKRKYEFGSQLVNFTKFHRLKHVLLKDNKDSRLKGIDYIKCGQNVDVKDLRTCLYDIKSTSSLILSKATFKDQLNKRQYRYAGLEPDMSAISKRNSRYFGILPDDYYNIYDKDFNDDDLNQIVTRDFHDIKNDKGISEDQKSAEYKRLRGFYHRMCFVLSQNFFSEQYFDKEVVNLERRSLERQTERIDFYNQEIVKNMEQKCNQFVANMFGYHVGEKTKKRSEVVSALRKSNVFDVPNERLFKFPPIVLERMARVNDTTGRYVYRGGKSLNINLQTGFNLSSSNGIKTSTSANFKGYEAAKDIAFSLGGAALGWGAAAWAGAKAGAGAGAATGNPIGVAAGAAIGAILGGSAKALFGAFTLSRGHNRDESAGRTQGTNVSSGTFLVSQQASIDIELGNYERCMVAKFHPAFVGMFLGTESRLKKGFSDPDHVKAPVDEARVTDVESLGVMICSGGQPARKCLPVKETYYYFTQHFTEGDMLDTADLHNHPWLLQIRGVRDFVTFTSGIGAREVDYVDRQDWWKHTFGRAFSDAAVLSWDKGLNGSDKDNKRAEFRIVEKHRDMNWPLEELSRTYFNVSPTFPGLYTFTELKPDWPNQDTSPENAFTNPLKKCEE